MYTWRRNMGVVCAVHRSFLIALFVLVFAAPFLAHTEMDFARLRREMVARTIAARGITNKRVLDAMNTVRREEFVPDGARAAAYEDSALPIGAEQTISQPYIVALTAEALAIEPTDKILDVGTGCGYAAAVLASLGREVYSIERIPSLASEAKERLGRMGFSNIHVHVGDGSLGLAEFAPYDAIAVAAGSPRIPDSLVSQLVEGGRIVIPVKSSGGYQNLLLGVKHGGSLKVSQLGGVAFVPLIGEEGYKSA